MRRLMVVVAACVVPGRAYGLARAVGRAAQRAAAPRARAMRMSSSSSSSSAGMPAPLAAVAPSAVPRADVVVIGGGHAGCEAAAASARAGARTVLLPQKLETIGEMSCNPSIGGIGKGHLVREVDALDGLMGGLIDRAGIHFRMLNRRKGPAVQGPRAQADRDLYREAALAAVLGVDGLTIHEGSVEDLLVEKSSSAGGGAHRVGGVQLAGGEALRAGRVVLTTGTFLRGIVHVGRTQRAAGRFVRDGDKRSDDVEPPTTALARTLDRLQLPLGRLKTGTPPRVEASTIDYGALEPQPSEEPPLPFSFLNEGGEVAMKDSLITCHKTFTNKRTHEIVLANAHVLPAYESGEGKGAGPRYCPSLFTKVERFPDRDGHMVRRQRARPLPPPRLPPRRSPPTSRRCTGVARARRPQLVARLPQRHLLRLPPRRAD